MQGTVVAGGGEGVGAALHAQTGGRRWLRAMAAGAGQGRPEREKTERGGGGEQGRGDARKKTGAGVEGE